MEGGAAVSEARRAQLERTADDLIERAVDAAARLRTSAAALDGWRLVRQKAGLRVLRAPTAPATATEPALLLGTGSVVGTVDDMVIGTYADSSDALRTSKALLSDKLIDAEVLRVFVANPPTAGVVFSGIKWFALKAPAGGQIIRDRDLLLFEGRIVDRSGRFFAYHVYHSIDLPERPANHDPALARAFMSMCYLFSPPVTKDAAAGTLDCFMLGRFHPGGSVPPALGAYVAADRMLSVSNAVVCAQARRFSRLSARAAVSRAPPASSYGCDLCDAAGATAVECAGCRRRACRHCHELRPVFRVRPRSRRPEKDPFCRDCIDHVARESDGACAFRGGRRKGGPLEDSSATGDECSGSSSSGREDSRRSHAYRSRSNSEDGGSPAPTYVAPDGDTGVRAARSHSLMFDPEWKQYIRVFDGGRAERHQSSPASERPGRAAERPKERPKERAMTVPAAPRKRDSVVNIDALD